MSGFMAGYRRDDKKTEELIATLAIAVRRHPDQRFGQLLANALGWQSATLFNVYDEKVIEALRRYIPGDGQAEVASTETSLERAIELLDQFDRGARVEEGEYAGSPFAATIQEFLEEHGKRG